MKKKLILIVLVSITAFLSSCGTKDTSGCKSVEELQKICDTLSPGKAYIEYRESGGGRYIYFVTPSDKTSELHAGNGTITVICQK